MSESIGAEDVAYRFAEFQYAYEEFRRQNGLDGLANVFETCTSMADKLGRVCRYVKHNERNDPKPDWEEKMGEEASGLIVYLMLLFDRYGADIHDGMVVELNKAIKQHSGKEENNEETTN